ncbi:MAG: porin [Planctomycetota bacterium]|jgi:phosphate-selective porin OprO/OprP|nr:porin [Planctomycetota bacterium]MDP6762336.1 porin [Planctomycetota bacterium]MDP6989739.1 porin [Planctomycetota bacterium]
MRPAPQPIALSLVLAAGCAGPTRAPATAPPEVFTLRSEDGRGELELEGLVQTVVRAHGAERGPRSDVALKRVRPELAGRFDALRFRLEPKFTEHEVELEEAWLGLDVLGGHGRLMLGRMKVPFNLEEVRSRRHIDFPHFSVLNQFAPAEDHGLFLNAMSRSGRWESGLSLTNGTGTSDTGSAKDLAGRLMWHPFAGEDSSPWRHLQVGLAATIGDQEGAVAGEAVENALGFPVLTFADGVALAGERRRVGLEAAWFQGPWFVQAEALDLTQRMSGDGGSGERALDGAYLTVSRVLTGEDKTFGGVRPAAPFDFRTGGGRGAWVLACRASQVDLGPEWDDLSVSGAGPGQVRTLSLGLNWIPNDHAVVRHALVFSDYDRPVSIGDDAETSEVSLVIEFQLHF